MAKLSTNKEALEIVAIGLGNLLPQMVFVGGAVTELYVPATADVAEIRPTEDVDCTIQLHSYTAFTELENELRKKGFENNQNLLIRWKYKGITVDIMPDDASILGFSNPWYKNGIATAITVALSSKITIQIFSYSYFLASKLTALFGRGIQDLRLSKDFEDIVFTLFYKHNVIQEISSSDNEVQQYIQQCFKKLLEQQNIQEAIYSVLPSGEIFEENIIAIKNIFKELAFNL
jgi:predicted nucleotidyltransferase